MKNKIFIAVFMIACMAVGFGFHSFFISRNSVTAENLSFDEQEATIRAIKKVMPAVLSIRVYDKEAIMEVEIGTNKQTVVTEKILKGSGTGFLISMDGLIITNKHVVEHASEKHGEYRITLNSGKEYYAQLIGKDPLNDIALLKIFDKDLPYVELGNSDQLQIGATVITIGNALGRYQNSAAKGIVSGLGRHLSAADSQGIVQNLDNIIQTDAEINKGNSGGPLIDLNGRVVGVNTAIDEAGTSIGFAIPIGNVFGVIKSALEIGRIVRPYLGVQYVEVTPDLVKEKKLSRETGAWIYEEERSVALNSPAAKAGILPGDIIFEINAIKIEGNNTLFSVIQKYKVGSKIGLKIQRGQKVLIKEVTLEELK